MLMAIFAALVSIIAIGAVFVLQRRDACRIRQLTHRINRQTAALSKALNDAATSPKDRP